MFCWLIKLLISNNIDNGTKNSGFVEKHLVACKSCCQFYDYAKNIEDKLKKDAETIQTKITPGTVNTIKFKLIADPVSHTTKMKSALIAAAACIVVALILSSAINIQKTREIKNIKQTKAQEALKYVLSAHERITENIEAQEPASKLIQAMAEPYKKEIDIIKTETETALMFLVSCVDVHIDDNQKNATIN